MNYGISQVNFSSLQSLQVHNYDVKFSGNDDVHSHYISNYAQGFSVLIPLKRFDIEFLNDISRVSFRLNNKYGSLNIDSFKGEKASFKKNEFLGVLNIPIIYLENSSIKLLTGIGVTLPFSSFNFLNNFDSKVNFMTPSDDYSIGYYYSAIQKNDYLNTRLLGGLKYVKIISVKINLDFYLTYTYANRKMYEVYSSYWISNSHLRGQESLTISSKGSSVRLGFGVSYKFHKKR